MCLVVQSAEVFELCAQRFLEGGQSGYTAFHSGCPGACLLQIKANGQALVLSFQLAERI